MRPPYFKVAPVHDGDQKGARQSGSQNKRAKGDKVNWTETICIIRSIAYQSRSSEDELGNLHINQGRINIMYIICISIRTCDYQTISLHINSAICVFIRVINILPCIKWLVT